MGKSLRSSQRFKLEKGKSLLPAQTLVGFSGKLSIRKLKPLRRSKSDKIREKALEQDYFQKCSTLECRLQDHWHLVELKQQLVCCNGRDFCDSPLCQELNERHAASIKLIKFLLEQVGTSLEVLPKQTQATLCQLLSVDKRLRVKLQSGFWLTKEQLKASPATQGADTSSEGAVFYQIFVHGIKHDAPLVLMLKQDDLGQTLWNMVMKKCPHKISSSFILLHQGRKITLGKTLREQGLATDCNIHAHFSLCGGMEKKESSQPNKGKEQNDEDPQKWTKEQVAKWITDVCVACAIDEAEVTILKTLSGAELSNLSREDWTERSPSEGDILFTMWRRRLRTLHARPPMTDGTSKTVPQASTTNGAKDEKASDMPVGDSLRDSLSRNTSTGGEQLPIPSARSSEKSVLSTQGPFGTVENIDKIEFYRNADELSRQPPADGTLISARGLCSSTPRNRGGAGSVLLRNSPVEGGTFLELKVDIRACPESTVLTKHIISTILNLKLGEELFVRGRIERLDKGLKSMKKGFEILPFKVIVDSDQHAAFRQECKLQRSYLRQLSAPLPTHCGIFKAEGSTQEPIFQNDTLEITRGTLYCPPDASLDKIKENAVALKNSQTGDIFVGVSDEGIVLGSKVSQNGVIQKRENIVRALSGILPNVDHPITVCTTAAQAHELVETEKDFVAAMWIPSDRCSSIDDLEETDEISLLFRIHVLKGSSMVSFARPEHTHAYVRVGAEKKLMTDYEDLFYRLESLASRNIPKKTPEAIDQEVNKASVYQVSEQSYHPFKRINFETEKTEFKAIYGEPKKIILTDYVKKYSASFLNSDGGEILFGIEEDRTSKAGYTVGVSISVNERIELVQESSKMICNFWPPVDSSQFFMKFIEVKCDVTKNVLKYPDTDAEKKGTFVALALESMSNVQKLTKFVASKRSQISLLRLSNNRFGLLTKDSSKVNVEDFLSEMNTESSRPNYFRLEMASFEEIEAAVGNLCVVHLHVSKSPYPIHLTSPLYTFCLDRKGMVAEMDPDQLIERFTSRDYQYEPDEFFNVVNGFEKGNTSYVLVCSPFSLPRQERDLYGAVVPEWALVLDFDQTPNEDGHLLNIFKPLHDLHQVERNLFIKTPLDRKLEINPRNGVCWCAVRGYEEINKTLSTGGHASWLSTHGHKMRILIDHLITHINPNQLVVLCLWADGHRELLPSLDSILQYIFSRWGPTKVVFVCSDSSTKSEILKGLVEPLERAGFGVKRDNIFVALPHEMARHVGSKLPQPYRSEDEFQIPRKFHLQDGGERTIPDTLPQTSRQAVKGHLQIMYQNTGKSFQLKPDDEDKVRVKFYSGSEIDETGLATGIAIEREKMKVLKRELKSFLNDKKSHVCLTILKAERGAGATTLCLQLLFEYRKQYVCARLLEFHDSLAANIEKINQYSRLPVILFVDSEMAYLQEFNDFKNDAEKRNLNLKLLVVESDALFSQQANSPRKKQPIPYFVGSTPYKTVELSRELTSDEVSQLIEQFLKIREISEEKKKKLKDLKDGVSGDCTLRKFAYFSLTAFGRKYAGIRSYVKYRLHQTTELQLQILEFLALTHVFTDFLFPVNALARLADRDVVMLESIFRNNDVRELLSPPSPAEFRRISFVEVAEELLQQQAKLLEMHHTLYLKDVALRLAKCALSDPRPSKMIERITRRLYVTSEYGSEKFSPLVRYLRDEHPDVARDMLHELIEIFEEGSSVWAHLLAHLSKYYMIQYVDFENAIPLIEKAVRENKDDVLLHHIHGDVIRLHVQNLKDQLEFSMCEVVRFAIQSSDCFVTVKTKRPLMEHGYSSDALVRKVVMLAAIKSVGGSHFVDFLKDFLNKRKEKDTFTALTIEDKYVLALVPESFANLRAVPINEFSNNLKDSFLKYLGDLDDLTSVCEDLKKLFKGTNDEAWVDRVVLKTTALVCSLEVEWKRLDPEEADERIRNLEDLLRKTNHDEDSVKIWIRCARLGSKVPSLKSVRSTVNNWLKATGKRSPTALFYNYVVAILEALSDPDDPEKMTRAEESVRQLLRKRKSPKSVGVSLDPSVPVEWLHPKEGRHINSLDSLLYHEDLVRDYLQGKTPQKQKRTGKEIIEKALFEKDICKWEGVVSDISSDWKGMITLKKRIYVPFVPVNVSPNMPNEGDVVRFCLAFHWTGPCAWYVVCQSGVAKAQKAAERSPIRLLEDETDSETSDKDDEDGLLPLVGESLHIQTVRPQKNFAITEDNEGHQWSNYLDCERQGIISQVFPSNGYGFIRHPDFKDNLFFHKKQIVPPVENLSSIEVYSVVLFTVGKTERGPRAMNIRTVEEKDFDSQLKIYREELRKDEHPKKTSSSASVVPRCSEKVVQLPKTLQDFHELGSRPEGHVCEVKVPPRYNTVRGYIAIPSTSELLYFEELLSGIPKKKVGNIQLKTIVQFSVAKNRHGFFAKDLFIKLPESKTVQCRCGWEDRIGKGIQEGFIGSLKPGGRYGFITKTYARERNPTGIYFNESHLRGYSFGQLQFGDRVHFVVGQNDKGGCVAEQIDVQFPAVSQGNYPSGLPDSRLFPRNPHMFLHGQPSLAQYSPLSPPFDPNAMPRHPLQDPGRHADGGCQQVNYKRQKR